MRGFVEIYKGRDGDMELIHADDNIIVDGAREHIADFLTFNQPPTTRPYYASSTAKANRVSYLLTSSLDTSNFNVRGITLGSARENYDFRHAKYTPSAMETNNVHTGFYHLLPYFNNHDYRTYSWNEYSPYPERVELFEDNMFESVGTDLVKLHGTNVGVNDLGLFNNFSRVSDKALEPDGWKSSVALTYVDNLGNTLPTDSYLGPGANGKGLRLMKKTSGSFSVHIDLEGYQITEVDQTYKIEWDFLALDDTASKIIVWDSPWGGPGIFGNDARLGRNSFMFTPNISSAFQSWGGWFKIGFATKGAAESGSFISSDTTIDNIKLFKQINQPFGPLLFDTTMADFTQVPSQWESDPNYNEDPYKQVRPKNWVVENEDYENWSAGNKTGTLNDPTAPTNYVSSVYILTDQWAAPHDSVSALVFNRWVGNDPLTTGVSSLGMYLYPGGSEWKDLSAGTYKLEYAFVGSNDAYQYQLYLDNYPGGNPVSESTPAQDIAFLDTQPGVDGNYLNTFSQKADIRRSIEFTVDEQVDGGGNPISRQFGIWVNKFIDPEGNDGAEIPVYCSIAHLRLYRRIGEDVVDPEWELVLDGGPIFDNNLSGPGLSFHSSEVGDRAILRQNIDLIKGNSYRFNVTASGSDPVSVRLVRQRHLLNSDATEYFNFDRSIFMSVGASIDPSTGVYSTQERVINLTKRRRTHSFDFRLPENPVDVSAFSEKGTSYYWEIVLPSEASDFLSDISIDSVDLIDLEAEVLRNSEFTETQSVIPNSDLLRKFLAPSYGVTNKQLKQIGVYDFSGPSDNIDQWRGAFFPTFTDFTGNSRSVRQFERQTHNPKIISLNPADTTETSGSVTYELSSVGLSSTSDEGYINIKSLNREYSSPRLSRAHFGAVFYLSAIGEFADSLGTIPNSVSDKSRNVPMQLSFWYSNETPAASLPLTVTLEYMETGEEIGYYAFSGYDEDPINDSWTHRNTWNTDGGSIGGGHLVLPATTLGEWRKASYTVEMPDGAYLDPSLYSFQIRFRPIGDGSNYRSTYIKGISFGPTPGWKYGFLGPSSTVTYSERDTLLLDLSSHTDNQGVSNVPFLGATLSGVIPNTDYSLVVKYKTKAGVTDSTEVVNLQLSGVTSDYSNRYFYNWGTKQKRWEKATPVKKKLSGTNGSFVTSSLPIAGMSTDPSPVFDVAQEYFLKIGHEIDAHIEFDSIKLIQSARIPYTGEFNKDSLSTYDYVRNQIDFTVDPFYWGNGITTYLDSSGCTVELISSGIAGGLDEGGYFQITKHADIVTGGGDDTAIIFNSLQKDLNINDGDIITLSYGQYDSADLGTPAPSQGIVLTIWDPVLEQQWYWDGLTWISDWSMVNKGNWTAGTGSPPLDNSTPNYPFKERIASGIVVQGSQFHDDTRWKVHLYTRNETGGILPYVHRRSPLKIYKTGRVVTTESGIVYNQEYSYASALRNEDVSPLDTTLQSASLDGSGPARLGHFVNAIQFSGAPEFSALKLEQVIQNGCYLPGSGLELDRLSFGHTDRSTANTFSGVLSGMLNQQSVINSDGYIYEASGCVSSYNTKDSSAGFVVSAAPVTATYGYNATSTPREVKYVLTLTANDWKFLNYYYGGIGNIGLHVFDFAATAKKFGGESANPPFLNRDKSTPYGSGKLTGGKTSLYNLTDPSKNPVFKLFAKKIFQPGGLKMNHVDYNEFVTIVWGIKF